MTGPMGPMGTMSSRQWRGASSSSPACAAVIVTSAPQTVQRNRAFTRHDLLGVGLLVGR